MNTQKSTNRQKTHPFPIPKKGIKTEIPAIYLEFINVCVASMRSRDLADTTIASRRGVLLKFLFYLTGQGIHDPRLITDEILYRYFYQEGQQVRGIDIIKIITISIKDYKAELRTDAFDKILFSLPDMRKRHKIYPYLTAEEVSKIEDFITNPNFNKVNYRDFAIFVLVYFTGLRRSDVTNLKIFDINWIKDEIHVTQGKNGKPIVLPLIAIVGNAIIDYIEKERPDKVSDYLFLTTNLAPGPMSGGTVYDSVEKIYHACGVRLGNERKGTHLLRHHMTMALLQSNTSGAIITEVLGHKSPRSIDAYLESDKHSLKNCALSIVPYPVGKEVFDV